jgi:hypothetical protein
MSFGATLSRQVFNDKRKLIALRFIRLCHFLSQTEWPHIRPDFFDVGQAFRLRVGLTDITPTKRVFPISRPYRILLFVVYNDFIDSVILLIIPAHNLAPIFG